VTRIRPHSVFTRSGADLTRELPITLGEALLGGEAGVETLGGRVVLTIPPGTQQGQTFRLAGKGMPRLKGEGSGDLYAKVKVVLPASWRASSARPQKSSSGRSCNPTHATADFRGPRERAAGTGQGREAQ